MLTSASIKARAQELGFELCGVAAAESYPELSFFGSWLARGYAGDLDYLVRTALRRSDVRQVLPGARSVVVLGTLYNSDPPDLAVSDDSDRAIIARYAWGADYHDVIARRLDALLEWVRSASPTCEGRAYVDTGPVQERVYAARAGLGWIGKNTCLINPEQGSWFFLSELILTIPLEPDEPGVDRCGTCTRCLEACPTQAFVEPYVLDARRCLSYMTIETKGRVPEEHREAVGTRIFGCDVCQDVCPWNRRAPVSADSAWQPRPALASGDVVSLFESPDAALRAAIKGSAMSRAGVVGLRRSLALATAASRSSAAREALVRVALGVRPDDSPSFDDEIVIEHIAWGLQRASRDELSGTESPRQ